MWRVRSWVHCDTVSASSTARPTTACPTAASLHNRPTASRTAWEKERGDVWLNVLVHSHRCMRVTHTSVSFTYTQRSKRQCRAPLDNGNTLSKITRGVEEEVRVPHTLKQNSQHTVAHNDNMRRGEKSTCWWSRLVGRATPRDLPEPLGHQHLPGRHRPTLQLQQRVAHRTPLCGLLVTHRRRRRRQQLHQRPTAMHTLEQRPALSSTAWMGYHADLQFLHCNTPRGGLQVLFSRLQERWGAATHCPAVCWARPRLLRLWLWHGALTL